MNNLLKYIVICFISASFLAACEGVDDKQLVETAKQYIESNKLRAANLELKNALQSNPENAEARYLLGQVNLTIGDMKSAAKEFRKAAEAGWDEGEAKIGLASAWSYSRQYEELLDEIEVKDSYSKTVQANLYGLRAYAEAALGYEGLAKVSIAKGEELDDKAFHVLKTAIQLDFAKGDASAAKEKLKTALSLYEDDVELLLLQAYFAVQDGETDEAASQYLKVIAKEPEVIVTYHGRKARIGLARLEIIAKNLDKAEELLAPLFKQNPNDPEVNYLGASLSFAAKDYAEAGSRILKVLKVAPEHARSQLLYGAVNFAQKSYEQAAYYLGKYLQQDPGNNGARKLLGRTYMQLGQHAEAQSTFAPGLAGEKDAELLALVGLSQIQAGDIESGIEGLQKALQAAPGNQALKNELARAYITAGETEKAITQLNAMIEEGGNKNQAEALKASAYLRAKRYDEAIDTVLNMLSRSPDDVAVLSLAGNVFAASGDRAEARKYFEKALQVDKENPLPMTLLAALEEVDGNTEEAERLYKQMAAKDGSSIDPLLALARLSEQNKDYVQMVSWLEKASEKAPMELRPKTLLAEYYLREKQFDKVDTLVNEASDITANDPTVLIIKSRAMIAQQRFNEAVSPLTELVTRVPNSYYARSLLGETYLSLGQHEDARKQLELALEQQPYYAPALLVLARVDQVTGRFDQALEHVEKVQKAEPEQSLAYDLGGDIYMTKKDYAAAKENYDKAMSLKPNSATAIKYAEALTRLSEKKQAVDVLEQWLSKQPDDVRVLQFLGNAYLNDGNNDKAIEAFTAVYEEQPKNVVAMNNLAWLYSLKDDPKALEFAEKAYTAKSEDPGIQDTYGWTLVQQGKAEEGLRILRLAMKSLSHVAEVRYHYAVALKQSGEEEQAQAIFSRLLDSNEPFEGREQLEQMMK